MISKTKLKFLMKNGTALRFKEVMSAVENVCEEAAKNGRGRATYYCHEEADIKRLIINELDKYGFELEQDGNEIIIWWDKNAEEERDRQRNRVPRNRDRERPERFEPLLPLVDAFGID